MKPEGVVVGFASHYWRKIKIKYLQIKALNFTSKLMG